VIGGSLGRRARGGLHHQGSEGGGRVQQRRGCSSSSRWAGDACVLEKKYLKITC